jgi:hypothetical protein
MSECGSWLVPRGRPRDDLGLRLPFSPLSHPPPPLPGKARAVPAAAGSLLPARLGMAAGRPGRRRCTMGSLEVGLTTTGRLHDGGLWKR